MRKILLLLTLLPTLSFGQMIDCDPEIDGDACPQLPPPAPSNSLSCSDVIPDDVEYTNDGGVCYVDAADEARIVDYSFTAKREGYTYYRKSNVDIMVFKFDEIYEAALESSDAVGVIIVVGGMRCAASAPCRTFAVGAFKAGLALATGDSIIRLIERLRQD